MLNEEDSASSASPLEGSSRSAQGCASDSRSSTMVKVRITRITRITISTTENWWLACLESETVDVTGAFSIARQGQAIVSTRWLEWRGLEGLERFFGLVPAVEFVEFHGRMGPEREVPGERHGRRQSCCWCESKGILWWWLRRLRVWIYH